MLILMRKLIGSSGVSCLSSALKVNSCLTDLNLETEFCYGRCVRTDFFYSMSNDIGEAGVASLSEALEVNSSLTSLNLKCNHIIFKRLLFQFIV